jgi:hypothetical protein
MVWVPFRPTLDRLFRSDGSLGLKMAGGAVVTSCIVVLETLREFRQARVPGKLPTSSLVLLGAVSAALGAYLVFALDLRDLARRRLDEGRPVGIILRIHSGRGCLGWIVWVPVAIGLTILLIRMIES